MRLIFVYAFLMFSYSCKKQCYECENKCYKCQGIAREICSDDYPSNEKFQATIATADTLGYHCVLINPTKRDNICNEDQKYALEQINYVCNPK